jgi:hypothetical protein
MVIGALLALACVAAGGATAAAAPVGGRFQVRHVFVLVLENESAAVTFGPDSPAPYLSKTLPARGAFVPNYYGVGHASLDNYIAMISGEAPNASTQADCGVFADFAASGPLGSFGQQPGTGCVYPSDVPTLPSQLTAAGLTRRSYDEDMGADPSRESATCGHPVVGQHDTEEDAHRHVRQPPRPVRLFPLDHRQRRPVQQPRRQPQPAEAGPRARLEHAQLHGSSRPTCATTGMTPPAPTARPAGCPPPTPS